MRTLPRSVVVLLVLFDEAMSFVEKRLGYLRDNNEANKFKTLTISGE
jgi:hypothetical protein